jgi:hypothetical protein
MNRINKIVIFALALFFASVSLMAQGSKMEPKSSSDKSFTGYVADKMCATGWVKSGDVAKITAKAMKHSKGCALEDDCQASGYGLVIDGKFYKFDEKGDKIAADFFQKSKKKSDFLVDVQGSMQGDVINVASIADAKPEKK